MPPRSTPILMHLRSLQCEKGVLMLDHHTILQWRIRMARHPYISWILTIEKQ
ncbi:hypothetical protein MKX01_030981 [Papaver californicum]|nr:hypothetical protein MKX01_030981 [Papaver californicum]